VKDQRQTGNKTSEFETKADAKTAFPGLEAGLETKKTRSLQRDQTQEDCRGDRCTFWYLTFISSGLDKNCRRRIEEHAVQVEATLIGTVSNVILAVTLVTIFIIFIHL